MKKRLIDAFAASEIYCFLRIYLVQLFSQLVFLHKPNRFLKILLGKLGYIYPQHRLSVVFLFLIEQSSHTFQSAIVSEWQQICLKT